MNSNNKDNFSIKKISVSIFILILCYLFAYTCRNLIDNIAEKERNRTQYQEKSTNNVNIMYNQIATFVFYSIIFISISIILPTYGLKSETLLAILGTIGLAIGLSSQHVLSNLWCGVVITFNDIYKIDDIVKLQVKDVSPDSSGKYVIGQIKSFNLFYTKMADLSTGQEISVPNNLLYNSIGLTTNQSIVYS